MSSTSGCVSPNSRVKRFAAASYSRINGTDTLISNCLPPNNMKRRWDAPRRERRAETKTLVSMTIRLFILVSYAIPLLVSTYDYKSAQRTLQLRAEAGALFPAELLPKSVTAEGAVSCKRLLGCSPHVVDGTDDRITN